MLKVNDKVKYSGKEFEIVKADYERFLDEKTWMIVYKDVFTIFNDKTKETYEVYEDDLD